MELEISHLPSAEGSLTNFCSDSSVWRKIDGYLSMFITMWSPLGSWVDEHNSDNYGLWYL